ncbi:hypothetical protein Tco_0791156 [Tanacetum coccineum]
MSEAENHPPASSVTALRIPIIKKGDLKPPFIASSVTALRIPIIKKGEYDLWCMKMRQYIAITDHILWDIITNGDQATTEPASSSGQPSAPKTSIVVNARRNNEKALNILLSAIPDRHLLSFHDAQDARSLWAAIKARLELDSAYDRFQNIISMLELYDAKRTQGLDVLDLTVLISPFVAKIASMPESHDDEDLLQIDDDAMEEIDIRWQGPTEQMEVRKKGIVPIEDSKHNALVALNGIEKDDWSIEVDADHVDLGQDGLGVFDWSEDS